MATQQPKKSQLSGEFYLTPIEEATPEAFILARTQKDAKRLMSVFEAGLFLIKKTVAKERRK
jgi:hypothetical protein